MLNTGIFISAFFAYCFMTYLFKLAIYNHSAFKKPPLPAWKEGQELALIFSPDLWWAFRFKNRIYDSEPEKIKTHCKKFVQCNNTFNLYFSFSFGLLTLTIGSSFPMSYLGQLLLCLSIIRFISRSYEITYAFTKDAFQDPETPSATDLNSKERIKLAMKSYIEIYFYSAPAYLILTKGFDPWAAVSLSLNVGTLTNVGLAFSDVYSGFEKNIVFFQVFTTLSLVIFSLAMYLARTEKNQNQPPINFIKTIKSSPKKEADYF